MGQALPSSFCQLLGIVLNDPSRVTRGYEARAGHLGLPRIRSVGDGFVGPRGREGKRLGHEARCLICSMSQQPLSCVSVIDHLRLLPIPSSEHVWVTRMGYSRSGKSGSSASKGFPGTLDGEGPPPCPRPWVHRARRAEDAWQGGVASRVLGLP